MNFANRAQEIREEIVKNRRHFHKHPELSMVEIETTKYLVDELTKMGIEVQTFDDYYGLIATIKGGKEGKTVLLRADIDALPITEDSGVDFESVNPGVMHACGHDCHTAMLLGAAKLLNEKRDELPGTVKLLFQSGEEAFIGSHYYWDKGHLNGIDAAFGVHVWPSIPTGKMAIMDGYLMASCDNFELTVNGKAAHGSSPHLGNDAIVAASAAIVNIQGIVSRLANPVDPLVVTIGTVRAGTQFNIIADKVVMEGTIRAYTPESREIAMREIERIANQTAQNFGCSASLRYTNPPEFSVNNQDLELNELARNSARTLYGEEALQDTSKAMGSEDFSYIMEHIPSSLFIFLGCLDEEMGCTAPVHNEKFKINEDLLPKGAAMYAQFAADYLTKNAGGNK